MQKIIITQPEKLVCGNTVRANNTDKMANIGTLVGQYFSQNIAANIPERKHPGITLVGYTQYDSNEHGDYTCFIGEEVTHNSSVTTLQNLIIPQGKYVKFTTAPGPMPLIVIEAWKQIWQMTPEDLGGKRAYGFDYEVYDQRAADPNNAVIDIYVGLK